MLRSTIPANKSRLNPDLRQKIPGSVADIDVGLDQRLLVAQDERQGEDRDEQRDDEDSENDHDCTSSAIKLTKDYVSCFIPYSILQKPVCVKILVLYCKYANR